MEKHKERSRRKGATRSVFLGKATKSVGELASMVGKDGEGAALSEMA